MMEAMMLAWRIDLLLGADGDIDLQIAIANDQRKVAEEMATLKTDRLRRCKRDTVLG